MELIFRCGSRSTRNGRTRAPSATEGSISVVSPGPLSGSVRPLSPILAPFLGLFELIHSRSRGNRSMGFTSARRRGLLTAMVVAALAAGASGVAVAGEPARTSYWDVKDIRPGMKGKGQTVMVGTKLEEFEAEVLGVMKDVSPGRDMVLCRLKGCNLEHAGIIQGMSGSPIYIDGKLLGAVAFAWEFAKDPIAGVTPFSQMVQYVRSNDRRVAAESKDGAGGRPFHAAAMGRFSPWIEGLCRR